LALYGSARAQGSFTDNFEGSTINSFWTVLDTAGNGSASVDTALAHRGKQSIQLTTTASNGGIEALSHTFPSPLYGAVSVWVYYDNVPTTGYRQLALFPGAEPDGPDYLIYLDWGTLQTYLVDINGNTSQLVPPLKTGWHQWTFSTAPKRVTFKIDNVAVFSRQVGFAFQNINVQQCCLPGSSFFDDFAFHPRKTGTLQSATP
jgi:hypothetical protein